MSEDAYFSGLIDGEAHIYTRLKKNANGNLVWRGAIAVAMTHEETIRSLYFKYGGSVCFIAPAKSNYKPQWRWTVAGQMAYRVAKAIAPWSITKKAELQIIVDHYELGEKPKLFRPGTKGEGNGSAKLTWQKVKDIRFMLGYQRQSDVARAFGVDPSTIGLIARGKTWNIGSD